MCMCAYVYLLVPCIKFYINSILLDVFSVVQLVLHGELMPVCVCVCLYAAVCTCGWASLTRVKKRNVLRSFACVCVCIASRLCLCVVTIFRWIERQRTLPYSIIQPFLSVLHEAVTKSATNTIKYPPYFQYAAIIMSVCVWTCDSLHSLSFRLLSLCCLALFFGYKPDTECRDRVRVIVCVVFGINGIKSVFKRLWVVWRRLE